MPWLGWTARVSGGGEVDLRVVLDVLTDVVTLGMIIVGGFLVRIGTKGFEAGVAAAAERGAQIAIDNANWPEKLSQELQKVRGAERQELRFRACALLWAKQRPLAIYDTGELDGPAAGKLSGDLSDWYFSDTGGLMLTGPVREFYFAFQDLLHKVSVIPNWRAERSSEAARPIFNDVLEREQLRDAQAALEYLEPLDQLGVVRDWPGLAATLAPKWREDIKKLAAAWGRLDSREHFAVLQQVSST